MTMNRFWIRLTGFAGILGGLTLFAGDMLFYFDSGSTNLLINMGNVSDFRIMASGVSALIATWLYMLGVVQVYYAFKPTGQTARNIVSVCFAGILIAYGVVHGAYVAIATTAKLSIQNGLDISVATSLASDTNSTIRLLVYPLFAVLSYFFISRVWKKKTLYPRWIILFFPLVPFLFQGFVDKLFSGSVWIVIAGGFLNLILVIFFTASTIALWNSESGE